MSSLKNQLNVFCARRRWLKKMFTPLLSETAFFNLKENNLRVYFIPKDMRGPSFHLAYDLDRGFQNYEEIDKDEIVDSLPEEGVFVDVGANIGLFSLYVSNKKPNVQIYSFEPNSLTRKCLESTKEFNHLNNLTIYSHAVEKIVESGKLYKSDHNDGGHSLNPDYEQVNNQEFEPVEIKPLDNKMFSNKKVNVIKIDVEGAEKEVLEGALDLIKNDKPMLIIEILNRDLIDKKGVYSVLSENFSDHITVRSPGDSHKNNFDSLSDMAIHNLSKGTEYNNYIFEFVWPTELS
jgi:FkbM family methyltransferase